MPLNRELDVLMLGTMFPKNCAVTAKKSLRRVPFLGWFSACSTLHSSYYPQAAE
jgi:hypothetical protein